MQVALYIATHNITGKKYFGKSTKYLTESDLQENYHGSGKYWTKHLKKHGDNVSMELYGIFSLNEEDKDYVEPIALKFSEENNIVGDTVTWANLINENGLNGGGNKGIPHTEETKLKCRNANLGRVISPEHRLKISTSSIGRVISERTKLKMSKSRTGIKFSKQACKDMSKARIGIKLSESHKRNIGNASKGRKHSAETKNKIREYALGNIPSEETKQKISTSKKNPSTETRQKLRDAKLGKPQRTGTCVVCKRTMSVGALTRWHDKKCKGVL